MAAVWTNDQIERLAQALVRCDAMKHPGNRDSVVERLEALNDGIARKEVALEDAISIVRRCAQAPEWMDALMRAVGARDQGTIFFTNAERVLETIKKELADMKKTPALADESKPTAPVDKEETGVMSVDVPPSPATGQASPLAPAQQFPETPAAIWEKIAAFAFGVVFLIFMIVIAIFIKDPTPFQYTFFRVAMSLAAAGVGAVIPGLIQLEVDQKHLPLIRAGGAIALFVLVYLFNPPKL